MTLIAKLFKTNKGALPPIYFLLPVILWVVGGLLYFTLSIKNETVKKKIKAVTMAMDLQKDINYISTKTKASEVFNLSKKDMIKSEKSQNFLMAKVKRKLDKSPFAKSDGINDETLSGFDKNLSPTLSDNPQNNIGAVNSDIDSVVATDDMNYIMNKIKADKQSKYHVLEEQRKQRLEDAKLENRRRREGLDKSTLSVEAAAYRKGLADNKNQYEAFHGTSGQQNKAGKLKKNGLSFSTTTGLKNDLKLNQVVNSIKSKENKQIAPPTIATLINHKNALKAVIDQKQKFRTGDKIQLRILENNFYNDVPIFANTLVYGICSISSNRLFINVTSINLEAKILPVSLTVYDLDGMAGIYIDGAYQDATKQAINEGLSDAGNLGLRNTLGNISIKLGRKANQKQTAFIPTGYTVLLFDPKK